MITWLRRHKLVAWIIALGSFILFIGLTLSGSSFAGVHQLYRQGNDWITVEHLGDPAYGLYAAPDGTIWAMNSSGLYYIRKNTAWSHLYTPDGHPTDFTLDGTTIWLVTHRVIVRCDTVALKCDAVQSINTGLSIAAWNGLVAAVTRDGQFLWFDKTAWHQAALASLLPGFDPAQNETIPKLIYTNDGSLWLKWSQLWKFKGVWKAVTIGSKPTAGVQLTGAAPGQLWTEWRNGLVVADPTLQHWQLFTWKEMNGPGNDWIFDLASAPDQSIWISARNGLLHFDGTTWTLTALPNNPLVTAVTVAPDGTLWVQITDTSSSVLSLGAIVGLGVFLITAVSMFWGSLTGLRIF